MLYVVCQQINIRNTNQLSWAINYTSARLSISEQFVQDENDDDDDDDYDDDDDDDDYDDDDDDNDDDDDFHLCRTVHQRAVYTR